MTFDAKRGSQQVEAAMIFPLVIIIVSMIISAGFDMTEKVRNNAKEHIDSVCERIEKGF